MKLLEKSLVKRAIVALSLCSAGLVAYSTAFAVENTIDIIAEETVDGNVELIPGYIGGTIDIGGQNITRIDLESKSTDYQAKIYPTSEGPYILTVNVPAGGSMEYTVSGTAWMDSYQTRVFFQEKTTTVTEAQVSQIDYIIDSGYVTGTLTTNGCSLAKSELWAYRSDEDAYSHATTKLGAQNSFRFPVQPNVDIEVYGQVQLSNGAVHNLEHKWIDVAPGQDAVVNWELPCAPVQLSTIKHVVDYHMEVDSHLTYLYAQGANSPSRTQRHDGSTLFDSLAPSNWRLYTYTYWNNNQNLIGKNFTNITTQPGETMNLVFDEYPGFLRGTLTLSGTHTIEDTSYAHIYAYGSNSLYPSNQVFSRALASNIDGSFKLALPFGEYSTYVTALSFYNSASGSEYLNSYLYMYDYEKRNDVLYIDAAQSLEGHDIHYETGSAVITFSRADGGTFSAPYINAKCYNRDENNVLQSYIYTSSRTLSDADRVTMIGLPGTYEVEAWAYVDGSLTTFGKVEIEIIPGVEKVVDIGGPALNVSQPAAGSVFNEATIRINGTATDETGVETITVNGFEVEFASTDNPDDLNEVSFSAEINLEEGENILVTVATDLAGNSSADNRRVTYTPPQQQSITGMLDIKPGSCKNPFNVTSKGVLPVVLLGTGDMDIQEIDPDSITLNSVEPLRHVIDDAAAYLTEGGCDSDYADGYDDLVLKFDSQAIADAIGEVNDGDVITLNLDGLTFDGTDLEANDTVTIIQKTKKK